MAAAVERNAPLPRFEIEEDSVLCKALSCIPLLGAIPALIQFSSLSDKINQEVVRPGGIRRCIELRKVRNDYMQASIVNGLLSVAIAGSLLYFGIFIMIGAQLLSVGITCTTGALYAIYATKEHLKEPQPMMRKQEDLDREIEVLSRQKEYLKEQMEGDLRMEENLKQVEKALKRQQVNLLVEFGHIY